MKHTTNGFLLLGLLCASTAAFGQYQAYDLGSLGTYSAAYGINNSGTIVGSYSNSDPVASGIATHAFVYQNGVLSDLGTLGGSYSDVRAINDQGIIVGTAYTTGNAASHAFRYQNGMMSDLGTLGGSSSISIAFGINNQGTIVGAAIPTGSGAWHAFRYQNGVMSDLGTLGGSTSLASGINDQGTIVGTSVASDFIQYHPFTYQNGMMSDLGTLGGKTLVTGVVPTAFGINKQGTIVGCATTAANFDHAFSYQNGAMSDLGTLGGNNSFAHAINDLGIIVGYSYLADNATTHAFVYQNGVMTDLDPYLEAIGMAGSSHALGINDLGEIVGDGGNSHAFLLVPNGVGPLQAVAPIFSPAGGTYANAQTVTITSATSGATIRYTTDGSTPTETDGMVYSGPVYITQTTTLQAIAYAPGFSDSTVISIAYTIAPLPTPLPAPVFSLPSGSYSTAQLVSITDDFGSAIIRYTTDGSVPSETNGTVYSGAVSISSTTMFKAIAYGTGFVDSPVTGGLYSITSSPAAGLNILYNFTSFNNGGNFPQAALVQGGDGNFYGTTQFGGSIGAGTVFKVTPAGILTTLVSFSGANGAQPLAALVQGSDGNFYGTTEVGGSSNEGTVFKMTPAGILTTLVSFNSANGSGPTAGLVQGSDGNLYGTTVGGGSGGGGTIFKMTPTGVLTTLVSFTYNSVNGDSPWAGLVQGSDGNFYGTTQTGGSGNLGTVFKVTPVGVLTTLVSFNGTNGAKPSAGLVQGSDGNFYGTTENVNGFGGNEGTVFKMTPAGVLTTLVSFNGTNGAFPTAALVQGRDGNFFGTTDGSGANDSTVFKVTPTGVLTTLVSFDGANGAFPSAGLVQGNDGDFYGTTIEGGISNDGVIFQLIIPPSQVPAPTFNLPGGILDRYQWVTITSVGASSIRYTTDGSAPSETNGIVYTGPVLINHPTTLQAIAYLPGFLDSNITSATYSFAQVPAPTFSPPGGTYDSYQWVTITGAGVSTVRYTTDGSTPSETNGIVSAGQVWIKHSTTLQAIAYLSGFPDSNITSAAYTINLPPAAAPTFNPTAGMYNNDLSVAITSATSGPGVSINYTTDGSTPTETHGLLYTGSPVLINASTTLQAIAFGNGFTDSGVSIAPYTLIVAPVTFSPPSGTYAAAQSVALNTTTNGATIRYTIDGSTPTETSGTIYSGPVNVSNSTMLKAIAYAPGFTDSAVTSGLYVITSSPAAALNVICNFATDAAGAVPGGSLVQGSDGNFYGTTMLGGSSGGGTVFKLTPIGIVTTLVSFPYGANPRAALVQGSDGNFYGTTSGTVFKITPAGTLTTLVNGVGPQGALVQGSDGNFYGTTSGTVFKMTPAGTLTTLVSFNGTNGAGLQGALVQGSDGNFYGTTSSGGSFGDGTVFKVTLDGVLTTLISFNRANGAQPFAGLVQGGDGNFYGTTAGGGSAGYGTVFKITPTGILTTLVSFTSPTLASPFANLVQGNDGNFYGTTLNSGNYGTIFKMTPTGGLITLLSFTGANGDGPHTGLIQGSDGNFYGTTAWGGSSNQGVVFQLVIPPAAAAPGFSPAGGTYTSVQSVSINTATSGATIRYTTDGSTPSETNGILYIGSPVTIGTTTTLQAIAYKTGYADSPVGSAVYTINLPPAAAPAFNPIGGAYNNDLSVTITSATSGASINYTTDGSTPTETHGTPYTGSPIPINASTTLQAIAFGNGFTDSAVSIAPYTMMVAPVTFSPPSGTYAAAQSVTLGTATNGATIRYTIDGSTPTETHGTIYSGPVTIGTTTTLQAIAYKTGYADSPVTTAVYTIKLTLNFEAESLHYSASGATTSVQTDTNSSGGKWVMLSGNSTGDHIDFTVPSVPAGTYQLKMEWKGNSDRGILQLSVDGTNLGSKLDQYSSKQSYPTTTFGNVIFKTMGNHTIRLTVTGKNKSSSGELLSADKFTLIGQ